MLISQLSIFVENKKGRLKEITQVLKNENVHIRALSIADTTDYGILRLIVNKPEVAVEALRKEGMTVSLTDVIAIKVPDVPGGLHKAIEILSDNEIGIEYMYAFVNQEDDTAYVIMRVANNDQAIKILTDNNIALMSKEEVYTI